MNGPGRHAAGATVDFDHVTKQYGARAKGTPGAVNDLSFHVPAGKICVLVGPSGCGKTTSLKMVNRLIEPTTGRIRLDGVDTRGSGRHRASARDRLRHPAGRPLPAPDHRPERGHGAAPARAGRRPASASAPRSC